MVLDRIGIFKMAWSSSSVISFCESLVPRGVDATVLKMSLSSSDFDSKFGAETDLKKLAC